jgi:hypothetical protein
MLRILSIVLAGLLVVGCDPVCESCETYDPVAEVMPANCVDEEAQPLVLGTFDGTSFTVLEEGAVLDLELGPQGGQHVFVSLRATPAEAGETILIKFLPEDEGTVRADLPTVVESTCETTAELRGFMVYLERDGYQKGVLHARIGECPADGCSFDAANQVTDFVVRSEVKLPVRIR